MKTNVTQSSPCARRRGSPDLSILVKSITDAIIALGLLFT
jgi:hypothetical protein